MLRYLLLPFALLAAPAGAQTAAEVNAALAKAGLPYQARTTVAIEVPATQAPAPVPTDLQGILSAVFPGIKIEVVQTGTLNYVQLSKGNKKARTSIGNDTVGEVIARLNNLVKYLEG